MQRLTASLVIFPLLICSSLFTFAQTTQPTTPQMAFGILDATPVKLRIGRTMSSADAKTGDSVDFEVLEEVKVGDVIVVPRGGIAIGTVTNAKHKGRMGKGGKLDINIDYVRLVNGEKVALRAVKETKGGTHTAAMTGAIVATAIVFFPAAPLFLFMKGKDITIPKGTEITAFVNGDIPLDPKRFAPVPPVSEVPSPAPAPQQTPSAPSPAMVPEQPQPVQSPPAAPQQTPSAPTTSSIVVKSDPNGAEIIVDGKFVGSTPSTLQLQPGDHTISLKMVGYKAWERTITLTAGSTISVDATLEKLPPLPAR